MEVDKQTDGQGRRKRLLLTVESKKMKNKKQTQAPRYREETGGCQSWRLGEMVESDQKIQTFSYKISKLWGCPI